MPFCVHHVHDVHLFCYFYFHRINQSTPARAGLVDNHRPVVEKFPPWGLIYWAIDQPGVGKTGWKPDFSSFQPARFIKLVLVGKFDLAGRSAQIDPVVINPRCGHLATTGLEKADAFSMGSSLFL
jgi:hypothetical protein